MDKAKILEEEQIKELLDFVAKGLNPQRDKVALLFGFKCGLRICEIARLKWDNVTDASGDLIPIGEWITLPKGITKGMKENSKVLMHAEVHAALLDLRSCGAKAKTIIYSSRDHRYPVTVNAFTVYLHRLYEEAGFVGCSSHTGRRTYITKMARICNLHGSSIKDVQLLARHADIRTTEGYIEPATRINSLAAAA